MNGPGDDDGRTLAIRSLLMAVALTPLLLVSSVTGSIGTISVETGIAAGLVGVLAGVPTFLAAERVDLRHVNDAVALVAMLALVVVATAVVWLTVPPGATPAFAVGCVGFIWAMALSGVSRHVVWPRFAAKTG